MSTIVNLNTEIIHRFVYELRYEFGQLYWDRSGQVSRQILNNFDDWSFDAVDVGHCRLVNRDQNLQFNFGPGKLDLAQTQNADVDTLIEMGEFAKLAEEATKSVIANLDLQTFSRIGFRVWHLYPANDREHANQLVANLRLFRTGSDAPDVIRNPTEFAYRVVTDRNTHMLRIAISPFEQSIELSPGILQAAKARAKDESRRQREILIDQLKAKKKIEHYPQFGVLLDLDAFLDDPPINSDLSVSDFLLGVNVDTAEIKPEVLASVSN